MVWRQSLLAYRSVRRRRRSRIHRQTHIDSRLRRRLVSWTRGRRSDLVQARNCPARHPKSRLATSARSSGLTSGDRGKKLGDEIVARGEVVLPDDFALEAGEEKLDLVDPAGVWRCVVRHPLPADLARFHGHLGPQRTQHGSDRRPSPSSLLVSKSSRRCPCQGRDRAWIARWPRHSLRLSRPS